MDCALVQFPPSRHLLADRVVPRSAGSSAVAAQTAPPGIYRVSVLPPSSPYFVGTQEGVGHPVRPRKRRWNVRRTDGRAGALAGPRRRRRRRDGDRRTRFPRCGRSLWRRSTCTRIWETAPSAPRRVAVVNVTVFRRRPVLPDRETSTTTDVPTSRSEMRSSLAESKCCCNVGRTVPTRRDVSTWNGMTARATPGSATTVQYSSALPSVTSTATTTQISCFWARKVRAAVKYAMIPGQRQRPVWRSRFALRHRRRVRREPPRDRTGRVRSRGRWRSGPGRWRRRRSCPDLRQQWQRRVQCVGRPGGLRGGPKRDRCLRRRRRRRSRPDDPRDRLRRFSISWRTRADRSAAPVIAAMVAGPGLP